MKTILFVIHLYFILTQFTNIKYKFETFKEKISKSLNKLANKDRTDENLTIIRIILILTTLAYYILVFSVIRAKWFQIIICMTFLWSMYDLDMVCKIFKGEDNKIMNSKLYSAISWIVDTVFYGYTIYYIVLNW